MKTLLLVIDIQKPFINENTNHLLNSITTLINSNTYDEIVFTKYINNENSILYKRLNYKEGITEEDRTIQIPTNNHKIIDKEIYSAVNEELKTYIKENNISKIYICGIDTECCVLKTAFDLFENNYDVYVLKDYCASTMGQERHKNALEILKRNIGYDKII